MSSLSTVLSVGPGGKEAILISPGSRGGGGGGGWLDDSRMVVDGARVIPEIYTTKKP